MTAADEVVERAEQWGRELDQPSAGTVAQAERLLLDHAERPDADAPGCKCGWRFDFTTAWFRVAHATHVVQELAAAGLLVALAEGIAS